MLGTIVLLSVSTLLQNASFTLVSRARNTKSLRFHAFAALCSNGIWLLVIRQVVVHLESWPHLVAYLVASVTGSVAMHWFSMRYLEKKIHV